MRKMVFAAVLVAAVAADLQVGLRAQGRGRGAQPPATARAAAPVDLTGYWTAVITEDWRWRMVTPAKGDYQSIPITLAAQKAADAWDPARDEAAGEQCKAYGTPGLMRAPTRLNISWVDDNTLKVESDYGMQTRLLRFGNQAKGGAPSWQGDSVAQWQGSRGPNSGVGTLVIRTSNFRPGYLRKNGVPYSASAGLTEYYDRFAAPNGDEWLVVTTIVNDPTYLNQDFVTSTHFKKEADGAKWAPAPCKTIS